MPRLLIVHHTPSPRLDDLLSAVVAGANADGLAEVAVVTKAALSTTAADVLAADGYILGTPANLGSMSGALKHFFDTIYYPCLHDTAGRPYGVYIHGNNDAEGARLAIEKITTGLGWRLVQAPILVPSAGDGPGAVGNQPAAPDPDLAECWELGASVAAGLLA